MLNISIRKATGSRSYQIKLNVFSETEESKSLKLIYKLHFDSFWRYYLSRMLLSLTLM